MVELPEGPGLGQQRVPGSGARLLPELDRNLALERRVERFDDHAHPADLRFVGQEALELEGGLVRQDGVAQRRLPDDLPVQLAQIRREPPRDPLGPKLVVAVEVLAFELEDRVEPVKFIELVDPE